MNFLTDYIYLAILNFIFLIVLSYLTDEKKSNFVYKNFSEKSWNDYIHLAWTCHPKVALSLALRVRHSEAIARSISSFIKSAPVNFYDSVDALHFLANPHNVKLDLPQLVHLLFWAPASPLEVLNFFSREYTEVSSAQSCVIGIILRNTAQLFYFC